jgi:predicted NAD-dependent protein-ADP-ribosyltransferase YbiA (DUF1768 family)
MPKVPKRRPAASASVDDLHKPDAADLWFYSASKPVDVPGVGRVDAATLSNFARLPHALNGIFWTVEAAFHAAKLTFTRGSDDAKVALREALQATRTGLDAKRLGGRKEFTSRGLVLDVDAWDTHKTAIMEQLQRGRAALDPEFRDLVQRVHAAGIKLRHFARGQHYFCRKTGKVVAKCALAAGLGDMIVRACT